MSQIWKTYRRKHKGYKNDKFQEEQTEKKYKDIFFIFAIPAIIGAYFSVIYLGWEILIIGAVLSSIFLAFLYDSTSDNPTPMGTRNTYIVDKRKFLGIGRVVKTEEMYNYKRTIEEEVELRKSFVKNLGGNFQAFNE